MERADTFTGSGQGLDGTQAGNAAAGPLDHPAMPVAKPRPRSSGGRLSVSDGQHRPEAQGLPAVADTLSATPTRSGPQPMTVSSGWLELRIWAEMFHDAQKQRIASVNRAERGGVDPDIYVAYIEAVERAEHTCRLQLRKTYRRVVPVDIREWQKNAHGIGVDLLARLLGHLGDPVIATPHHWEGTGSDRVLVADPPFRRTVAQLWQFCGHGAPGRVRKGMTADELAALGNPNLKMIVHLMAECAMKQMSSPYRVVYDDARAATVDKLHTVECVRCGPSGKPAQPGTPWNPGHQHAHALRVTGKEILRDLWLAAGGGTDDPPASVCSNPTEGPPGGHPSVGSGHTTHEAHHASAAADILEGVTP
jgi:hypothetical protein